MSTSGTPARNPDPAGIRVAGEPTDEELAAVLCVLLAARRPGTAGIAAVRSAWRASGLPSPGYPRPGPDGWRRTTTTTTSRRS